MSAAGFANSLIFFAGDAVDVDADNDDDGAPQTNFSLAPKLFPAEPSSTFVRCSRFSRVSASLGLDDRPAKSKQVSP